MNGPILWFKDIGLEDLPRVGGKNASLGEMIRHLRPQGVAIPDGFCVTAQSYLRFLQDNDLEAPIGKLLSQLADGSQPLSRVGEQIRELMLAGDLSDELTDAIDDAYQRLGGGSESLAVAVRSSATAEDLPEASFAGQQESFLNIRGKAALLHACQRCFASLYTDRAIAYREEHGFAYQKVALSVGVQLMVRSDQGAAGVAFTLDTESGFPDVVVISGSWGLGESVVQGRVVPDKFMVFKPLLDDPCNRPIIEKTLGSKESKYVYRSASSGSIEDQHSDEGGIESVEVPSQARARFVLKDDDILQLARWCCQIEKHYQRPMDIEWAKAGRSGQLYILQARPETIESRKPRGLLTRYRLLETGEVLARGSSVGAGIATGEVCVLRDVKDSARFRDGSMLVTERTDPDWVPLMRRAAGIITDTGGPTSHAAIVSRELKLPAIVGTGDATRVLVEGDAVTLSCAEGASGKVYRGRLAFETLETDLSQIPETRTDLMINMAMPDSALQWWQLPVRGIGLTRIEFIISSFIRVHPMALVHFEQVTDRDSRREIEALTAGFPNKSDYFVEMLSRALAKIAASQYPHPVIVRMSDFKSNEYRCLLGGEAFEREEANPMLGFRGAARYHRDQYRDGFKLECLAIKKAREVVGLKNIVVMIPFCRTPTEAQQVLDVMAECGLVRGEQGLQVYVMCEIPSNVVLADRFSQLFDGFSIGSNDLTQLVLGIDRDSQMLADIFDARDEAVKRMISDVIRVAHQYGRKVGICGQAPSDHPEFAEFLVEQGIDSISLNPDSVLRAAQHIAQAEASIQGLKSEGKTEGGNHGAEHRR